jgi:4-diphosphocytidyl-2-C-methyl-D-erythritol kinase
VIEELARAKVNLALHVLGRRADGYHDLDSIAAFADVGDRLSFEPAPSFALSVYGPFAHGLTPGSDNLVLRAADALMRAFPGKIAPARILLEKNLPLASGLGGGSADAAATLRGLPRLSDFSAPADAIGAIARDLGADVPACIGQVATRMRGVGDDLERLDGFAPLSAVLINPGVPSRTPDVFAALRLRPGAPAFRSIASPMDLARCRNDLETPAKQLTPSIGTVLSMLRGRHGLKFARMTGSGATCFGIYETAQAAAIAVKAIKAGHPNWWCIETTLR